MARSGSELLGKVAYNQYGNSKMLDPRLGNQNGWTTDISSYISNSAYVRRNLICVLLEAPRGFQDLEKPDYWVGTLKALFELHAKNITGLRATLTVEHIENAVGGAGEVQHDISNVTRERSEPVFTWVEKYGLPITTFLNGWVLNLIMDPSTKYPLVVTRGTATVTDLLPDYTGASALFFEPDPTGVFVMPNKAWLCVNMRPNGAVAPIEGERDLTVAGAGVDIPVTFTAFTQVGSGVEAFAQSILNSISLEGANPNLRKAGIQAMDSNVKKADTDGYGYSGSVSKAASNTIGAQSGGSSAGLVLG